MGKESIDSERNKDEYNVAVRLFRAVDRALDELRRKDLEAATSGKTFGFKLEPREQRLLMEINGRGLMEGLAAGILTFVALRKIRSRLAMRWDRFDPSKHAVQNPSHPVSPFQPPPQPPSIESPQGMLRNSWLYNSLTWVIDGLVSFNIAVFVSVRDPGTIASKLSELPLMEGKSQISDIFCPPLLRELRNLQAEAKTSPNMTDLLQRPQTEYLKYSLQFCKNCVHRQRYESLLRQQSGLSETDPVNIPPPGVPRETTMEDAWILQLPEDLHDDESRKSTKKRVEDDDFFFYEPADNNNDNDNFSSSSSTDTDWADGFVQDQEEQS
jgi:hypothetical protein